MISVVLITYNSSSTVLETLESIYNQTYKEIELVLTDDGSSDNTIDICNNWIDEHRERFENVIILEHENTGVSGNCNRGIFASSGEYIQIIAGDDILHADAFEKKLLYAKENGLNVVFSKVNVFGEDDGIIRKINKYCDNGYKIIKEGYFSQKKHILNNNFLAGPSGGFFDSKYIKKIGGYDERYPMIEDYPFIYHYIYSGNSIIMMDEELVDYRVYNSSLSNKSKTPMMKSYAKFFFRERMIQMFRENKFFSVIFQTLIVIAKYYLLNTKLVMFFQKLFY